MKLIFLGCGSSFTVGTNNYQSNMLLQNHAKKNLLIDCGGDVRHSLHELGYSWKDINSVYISHLHADHVGGLEWLALCTYISGAHKPKLYTSQYLLDDLWHHVLYGGLQSLSQRIEMFFDVIGVNEDEVFQWEGQSFQIVKTDHISMHNVICPSYGLYFEINNKKIFITTDSLIFSSFYPFYQKADLIFHDCETASLHSKVHAHYDDLKNLEFSIRKKMWLYHYNDGVLPDAKAEGFLGFVHKGQVFEF